MTPKNPTNSDLLKVINEVKDMQIAQGRDISTLKQWRESQEVAKRAVDEYRKQEDEDKRLKLQDKETVGKIELLSKLTPLIVTLGAIAAIILLKLQK